KTPEHVDDRRGFPDAARRGERRLEFVAANTLHEMRNAVGQESAGDEVREIVIPRHDTSFAGAQIPCRRANRRATRLPVLPARRYHVGGAPAAFLSTVWHRSLCAPVHCDCAA